MFHLLLASSTFSPSSNLASNATLPPSAVCPSPREKSLPLGVRQRQELTGRLERQLRTDEPPGRTLREKERFLLN